ncbi:hypothetical protein [Leisingera sp.]|uniref:hypothetical protein n=1 Tax=Leisingera sp. TaxID=1879318 RepID=UPI002B26A08A|nr:hypothetical protein [Leisingera sp.]
MEKHLAEALSVHNLNLPSYNTMICAMVQKQVKALTTGIIAGRLQQDLEKILSIAPKSIKLSEIVEEMRQPHEGDGSDGVVVTCTVEHFPEKDSDF